MTSPRFAGLALVALTAALAGCGGSGASPGATTTSSSTTAAETSSDTSSSSTTSVAAGDDTTPAIVAAANAFLATLDETATADVQFDWTDTAQKQRWSNYPEGLYERDGLMWGNLTEDQRNAWLALMQVTLSEEGYNRVLAEWNADSELGGGGGGGPGGNTYGTDYYWVAFIGMPYETEPWQWQWGGHHVTVNATIAGSEVSLTPSFIGCQPCTYTDDSGAEVKPLGDIVDQASALVGSLDATQQASAVLGSSAIDLVLGPGEDGKTIASEGIAGSALNDEQKAALLALIGEYGNLVNAEDAAARVAELEADLDQTYFAWYGPITEGGAAYFRVTGPSIVIEYSPQTMGGDATDHIHGIYRDPTNDYGAKITG